MGWAGQEQCVSRSVDSGVTVWTIGRWIDRDPRKEDDAGDLFLIIPEREQGVNQDGER